EETSRAKTQRRKGAKKALETRQRVASLRLCASHLLGQKRRTSFMQRSLRRSLLSLFVCFAALTCTLGQTRISPQTAPARSKRKAHTPSANGRRPNLAKEP